MIDAETWEGVQSLLDNYLKVQPDDVIVLVYAPDSYESAAWVSVALEVRNIDVRRLSMAPLKDQGFHERFRSALPAPAELARRLVVMTFERDTMSHDRIIRAALADYDPNRCAVFRAISAGRRLFSCALRIPPEELSMRNTALLERFMVAKTLRIETSGGTALHVGIDSDRYRWISNRGVWRPGHLVILPAGEVATFPASISGVLVADFAFHVNAIIERDVCLSEHPITIYIEEGRIGVENVGRVNSHVNERRPSVHLGFGQHNQAAAGFHYQCNIHLDLIAKDGLVWVDGEAAAIDLMNVMPSCHTHPTNLRNEDIVSLELNDLEIEDCCGVFTSDGLRPFPSPG